MHQVYPVAEKIWSTLTINLGYDQFQWKYKVELEIKHFSEHL